MQAILYLLNSLYSMKITPLLLILFWIICNIDARKHKHLKKLHLRHMKHHKKVGSNVAKPINTTKTKKKSSVYERPETRIAVNEDSERSSVDKHAFEKTNTATSTATEPSVKHAIAMSKDINKDVNPGEFKTCTDAACDESGEVDTSEWVILKKHKNNLEASNYVNENEASEKTNIETKLNEGMSGDKKKELTDIFSSIDFTTNNTQTPLDENSKQKQITTTDLKENKTFSKQLNQTAISKKNISACTEAACKTLAHGETEGKHKNEKQNGNEKNVKIKAEIRKDSKEITEDKDVVTEKGTKNVGNIEQSKSNSEGEGKNLKEVNNESKAEANKENDELENEDIKEAKERSQQKDEKAGHKTGESIIDQLTSAVQATQTVNAVEKHDEENGIDDVDKGNISKEKEPKTSPTCTDAACSSGVVENNNDEIMTQSTSECRDEACSAPKVDKKEAEEKEHKEQNAEGTNSTSKLAQEVNKLTDKDRPAEAGNIANIEIVKNENNNGQSNCTGESCLVASKPKKGKRRRGYMIPSTK